MSRHVPVAPEVVFRCDATVSGGMGHFVRCMALVQALRAAGAARVHVSGDVTTALAREMLAHSGARLHPPARDSSALMMLARDVGGAVVHIDRYEGFDDVRATGRAHGIVTSTATDERFGRRAADVIVDGSPRTLREFDELYADSSVALGPAYLALRDEFASALPPVRRTSEAAVLVVMGGTDAAGYGPAVAEAIANTPGVGRVGVVGSGGSAAQTDGRDGVTIESVDRSAAFRALVAGWDLVVTGAGTTVWELAALGVPMAVLGVAENQREHYDTLVGSGLAVGLGFLPDPKRIDTRALADLLADPLEQRRMATAGRELVDGCGAGRIIRLWADELADRAAQGLTVRPAGPRDAGRLYAWRNDPESRRWSRSTEPVQWRAHVAWLTATLADSERFLTIGTVAGRAIGTARFDALAEGVWEVSVTIAPEARGKGWSSLLVRDATAALVEARSDATRVVAELRTRNEASRAVFAGLGYRLTHREEEWERWESPAAAFRARSS